MILDSQQSRYIIGEFCLFSRGFHISPGIYLGVNGLYGELDSRMRIFCFFEMEKREKQSYSAQGQIGLSEIYQLLRNFEPNGENLFSYYQNLLHVTRT